jgi:hypothetical protein
MKVSNRETGGIEGEYEGAELKDARLERRLVRLASRVSESPEASFPNRAENDSQLEATYRFLGNDKVSPSEILGPHTRQTVRRATEVGGDVVVAHDTTEFNFGKTRRRDLGRVGLGESFGFYGHFALAVSRETRNPLGVLGMAIHQRSGKKGVRTRLQIRTDPNNEGLRWGRSVAQVEKILPRAIHAMDREADSYMLMAELVKAGYRFVIRMAQSTRKLTGGDISTVGEALVRARAVAEREVPICARGKSPMPSYRKHYPPRTARAARLEVSSETVTIARPDDWATLCETKHLTINVVRVFEVNPPPGEPPVEWRLWTTEPIETPDQVLAVVDAYRCRWLIEEYFKALKTGCAIEQRQLETTHALVNALAIFAPIAWRLMYLRTLAREEPTKPTPLIFSDSLLACLRFMLRQRKRPDLSEAPTAAEIFLGIAAVGGHLKRNGPPGWAVIGRGYDKLLCMQLGYEAAIAERYDQS